MSIRITARRFEFSEFLAKLKVSILSWGGMTVDRASLGIVC